jgi:hypothetical protein
MCSTEQTTRLYPIHHFELVTKPSHKQHYKRVLIILAKALVLVTEEYCHVGYDATYPNDGGSGDLCNDGTNLTDCIVFSKNTVIIFHDFTFAGID